MSLFNDAYGIYKIFLLLSLCDDTEKSEIQLLQTIPLVDVGSCFINDENFIALENCSSET